MLGRRGFLRAVGATGAALALSACSNDAETSDDAATTPDAAPEPVSVRAVALKGPTAMGLVKFMSEADAGELSDNDYSFSIVASTDEVSPLIAKEEVDIAAVPANLASVLYNKTDRGVRTIAINTLGVLYICEQGDSIQTVGDLAGRTVYASGKGATPEYGLTYILEKNGLELGTDVMVEWKSEHSECVAALAEDATAVAMLPQPFVTTAQMSNDQIRVALDLTAEWEAVQKAEGGDSAMITGVAVVRSSFADEHPEAVDAFLEHYASSVEYVNDNVADAAQLVGDYDIVAAKVAEKAIPACNIVCVTGQDMADQLSGYLEVLFGQNPEAVGGAMPGDDFYYGA